MGGVSAILTAAGESTRMGRPKPLLPWQGTTLVEYQVQSLTQAGAAEVVVVLGHESDAVAPYVKGPCSRWVLNPDYRLGRTSSIRAGLSAIDPDADAILLLGVDQPRTEKIVSAVIDAHARLGALITSPRYRGRGGHPLIFSASLKDELQSISEEGQGIRQVFDAHRGDVSEVEIDDSLVRLDLNTPEAYKAAKARYGGFG